MIHFQSRRIFVKYVYLAFAVCMNAQISETTKANDTKIGM